MTRAPVTMAARTLPQAIAVTAFLPIRPRRRTPFRSAPRKGKSGMVHSSSFIAYLPLELRRPLETGGVAEAEEGDQDAQPHGRLPAGEGDGGDREDLARQVRPLIREGDEVDVDGVEHQLD